VSSGSPKLQIRVARAYPCLEVLLHRAPLSAHLHREPAPAPDSGLVIHDVGNDAKAGPTRLEGIASHITDFGSLSNRSTLGAENAHDPGVPKPWVGRNSNALHAGVRHTDPSLFPLRRETDRCAFR
jgi:hypothetical protein